MHTCSSGLQQTGKQSQLLHGKPVALQVVSPPSSVSPHCVSSRHWQCLVHMPPCMLTCPCYAGVCRNIDKEADLTWFFTLLHLCLTSCLQAQQNNFLHDTTNFLLGNCLTHCCIIPSGSEELGTCCCLPLCLSFVAILRFHKRSDSVRVHSLSKRDRGPGSPCHLKRPHCCHLNPCAPQQCW